MIKSSKFAGLCGKLKVFQVDDGTDYTAIFRGFLEDSPEVSKTLLCERRTGPIWKISFRGRVFLIKHDLRKRHRFDYLAQSFFCGSNAERLIRGLEKMRENGFDGAYRIFLVADNRHFGCTFDSWIMMEFLEGVSLDVFLARGESLTQFRVPVAKIVHALLRAGMVHGDINPGNFMRLPDGRIKAIDISGKPVFPMTRAIDRKWLRKFFGVPASAPGFDEKIYAIGRGVRKFFQRLRGAK